MLGLLLLAAMAYLVITPLLTIVQASFMWTDADRRISRGLASPGSYTVFHWMRCLVGELSGSILWRPLWNSVVIAVGATTLSITHGGFMAWLTTRTNLPGRRYLAGFVPIPYVVPSWPLALAWISLFKSAEMGGNPGLIESMTGAQIPLWLSYGPVPIIICESLHYYAFAFLFLSGALATLDSRLEESAEMFGASRLRILTRITFPLMLPALLSAVALTFSRTLSAFGTPYFLGVPVRYYTLPMMVYTNMNPSTGNPGDGFVLAIVLIVLSALVVFANQRLVGTRKSFATVTGKGFTTRLTTLGRLRWPMAIGSWVFIGVCVVGPLLVIVWQSLMLRDGDYGLHNLTLHYWVGSPDPGIGEGESGILLSPSVMRAGWNSILLSLITAVLCAVVGLFLGYAIARGRGTTLSRLVEQVSFLPFVVPSIAFGAVYLTMFAQPVGPMPALYGTFALLVLISVVSHLPYSSRSGTASMLQLGAELEEAAVVAGVPWWRRFLRIIVPLTKAGLLSGFLLTFITTMRELALIVLLVTPSTRVLTTMTFRYQEQGYPQFGSAIVVVIVAIVISANFAVTRYLGPGRHASV